MTPSKPRAGSLRIIFLTEDAPYADQLSACLESLGHRVATFSSFVSALEELEMAHTGIDLFLADLNMTTINGLDVVGLVHDRFQAQACAIIASNLQSNNLVARAMRAGVFLAVKPTTPSDWTRFLDDVARLPAAVAEVL